jgi:hypothetical protein
MRRAKPFAFSTTKQSRRLVPLVVVPQAPGGGGDPGTPPNGQRVVVRAIRHDGLSGPARAHAGVPLMPGAVQPAALSTASLWDLATGLEVPFHISDLGARHVVNNVPNGLLLAYVEVDATFTTPSDELLFELRFDVPAAQQKQAKQGITRYSNPFPLGLSADGKSFRLTAPFTYWFSDEDGVRRHAGNVDVAWEFSSLFNGTNGTPHRTVTPTTNYQRFDVMFSIDAAGTARVVPYAYAVAATAPADAFGFPPKANGAVSNYPTGPSNRQYIGFAAIYVPAGVTYTLGVTDLRTAGIVVTLSDTQFKPYSYLPDGGPTASLTPDDTAYLCACEFAGEAISSLTDFEALGVSWGTAAHLPVDFADMIWRQEGAMGALDSGPGSAYTMYAPALAQWLLHAQTGGTRFFRRAVHYMEHTRRKLFTPGSVNWANTWEPGNESVGHIVDYLLTGDGYFLPDLARQAARNERDPLLLLDSSFNSGNYTHSGTGRRAKHLLWSMAWSERAGLNLATMAGGTPAYLLQPHDVLGWANADYTSTRDNTTNLRQPTTNALRWRRMYERITSFMKATTATYPANAGKRYYNISDYQTSKTGPYGDVATTWFMPGFTFSELVLGFKVFGEPADALAMIRDHMDFEFTGVSEANGTARYCSKPGQEQVAYYIDSATPTGGYGVMLNNTACRALAWLYEKTGDDIWKQRADTLYLATNYAAAWSNLAYQAVKLISELALHTGAWPRIRAA